MDTAGNVRTLYAEGTNMMVEGKTARYKDVIKFNNDDHRIMTSHALGDDGKWQQLMKAHYRRKK